MHDIREPKFRKSSFTLEYYHLIGRVRNIFNIKIIMIIIIVMNNILFNILNLLPPGL